MESRRARVLAVWLNLRLARPPSSTILPPHGADSLRRAVQLSFPPFDLHRGGFFIYSVDEAGI
jgi:hypothetical protein